MGYSMWNRDPFRVQGSEFSVREAFHVPCQGFAAAEIVGAPAYANSGDFFLYSPFGYRAQGKLRCQTYATDSNNYSE